MQIFDTVKKARGEETVAVVIKNARIINVFTSEVILGDIGIHHGMFLGIGNYKGKEEIDVKGAYVAPGFIDAHVHIESSMLTPPQFASLVLPFGSTTVIADPHEIANVSGVEGIKYMMDSSHLSPLEVLLMIPSCVPASSFETSGASIDIKDIQALKKEPNMIGLGEVMDVFSVIEPEVKMHEKLKLMRDKVIDGHSPGLEGLDLNAYCLSGIQTDHECATIKEAKDRIDRGMYVHLRHGSAAKNLTDILPLVNKDNHSRFLFCTDDKHPEDIFEEGHINHNVNLAISHGLDPILAIKIATINAAICYKLPRHGAIAPGYTADFIVFDDLSNIQPKVVYKKGIAVAKEGKLLYKVAGFKNKQLNHTVHVDPNKISFFLPLNHIQATVIELNKDSLITNKIVCEVKVKDNGFVYDEKRDILKLACVERHLGTNRKGLALVKGYGLKQGALAISVAHDAHNILIIGTNDEDMKLALTRIQTLQGGLVYAKHGEVLEELQLELAGIMTSADAHVVRENLKKLVNRLYAEGVSKEIADPIATLSFLALTSIPSIKITDFGLYDVYKKRHITITE